MGPFFHFQADSQINFKPRFTTPLLSLSSSLCFAFILFVTPLTFAKKKSFSPTISMQINMTGDLTEIYQFDGPLGSRIEGAPEKPNPVCALSATFQNVFYREKKMIEAWFRFKCTVAGQTDEIRPSRLFLDPQKPEQTVVVPALTATFKNLTLKISELAIK